MVTDGRKRVINSIIWLTSRRGASNHVRWWCGEGLVLPPQHNVLLCLMVVTQLYWNYLHHTLYLICLDSMLGWKQGERVQTPPKGTVILPVYIVNAPKRPYVFYTLPPVWTISRNYYTLLCKIMISFLQILKFKLLQDRKRTVISI